MIKKWPFLVFIHFLLGIAVFWSSTTNSQDTDTSYEIKQQIEFLISSGEIEAANRLLNQRRNLQPEYVLNQLKRNLELSTEAQDIRSLAYTHLTFGNFWYSRGNKIKAYEHYRKCETLSREINDELRIGLSLLNLANLEDNPDIKSERLRSAIYYLKQKNSPVNVAKGYLNMGNVYLGKVNFDTDDDYQSLNRSLAGISKIKIKEHRDSAFHYYNMAQLIIDSIGDLELMSSLNVHYAEWYEYDQDFPQAEEYYKIAHDYFNLAGLTKGSVYCMLKLSSLNIRFQKYDTALILLKDITQVSKRLHYVDYLTEAYQKYVSVYDSLGKYQEALHYDRHYNESSRELDHLISQDKISLLNLQYNQTKQEIEIDNLENKKKVKNLIIVLFSILTLFILFSVYIFRRNSIRKMAAADDLIKKNKQIYEIEQSLLQSQIENQLLQKELLEEKVNERSIRLVDFANEMSKIEGSLQQLQDKVKAIKPGKDQEQNIKNLRELQLSISQNMDEQRRLKELSSLTSTTNQDFFFYIDQHYKNITKDEKQLLSFLIQDMSSKEISEYLYISTESVHKKRYRLRKKLNLEHGESFLNFYSRVIASLRNVTK